MISYKQKVPRSTELLNALQNCVKSSSLMKSRLYQVSWYHEKYKVCLSLPVVLSDKGIERIIELPLTLEEEGLLAASAKVLQDQVEALGNH